MRPSNEYLDGEKARLEADIRLPTAKPRKGVLTTMIVLGMGLLGAGFDLQWGWLGWSGAGLVLSALFAGVKTMFEEL